MDASGGDAIGGDAIDADALVWLREGEGDMRGAKEGYVMDELLPFTIGGGDANYAWISRDSRTNQSTTYVFRNSMRKRRGPRRRARSRHSRSAAPSTRPTIIDTRLIVRGIRDLCRRTRG